jgi:hypothetical protein
MHEAFSYQSSYEASSNQQPCYGSAMALYVCIYMFVCTYMYMCVYICICNNRLTEVQIHIYTHKYIYIHTCRVSQGSVLASDF